MSVELKIFGGAYFVKDKALKKNPSLTPLTIAVKAPNKGVAEAIMAGKLAEKHPANIDDYFKAKVWENADGIPCPIIGDLLPCFFTDSIIWNAETGTPEYVRVEVDPVVEPEEEKLKTVKLLGSQSRAACLVLYGPVADITTTQYGSIIDLVNDEDGGFEREFAEAIVREQRVLNLSTARQVELLAHVRETAKETAQWTDIKKIITKWLDTPPNQRESVKASTDGAVTGEETHTESGCTLGGGNVTDRVLPHTLATLRREVCLGILAIAMDFDIYELPHAVHERAKKMEEVGTDERFTAWWKQFRRTPGILDYSKAAIIALIKSSPEGIYHDPVALREYINKNLTESDHANPDPLIVDIACGRSSAPLPQKTEAKANDETKPPVQGEAETTAEPQPGNDELSADINGEMADHTAAGEQSADKQPEFALTGRALTIKTYTLSCVNGYTLAISSKEAGGILNEIGLDFIEFSNLCAEDISTLDDATPLSDDEIYHLVAGALRNWHLLDTAEDRCEYLSNLLSNLRAAAGKDNRLPMDAREIEIAHALNDLLSGRTDIMAKDEAEGVVTCTGHLIPDVLPDLLDDMVATEYCLHPNFSDEEIHDVATTILDSWSDNEHERRKIAMDAIVEYRRPEPPKAVVIDPPVVKAKPRKEQPQQEALPTNETGLTYLQQLTIAAVHGLCANPAYRFGVDDIPHMATELATGVVMAEGEYGQ